jgi:hypothetical protein
MPHITKVNIRESQEALIESVYRISSEILHHKWLHKQRYFVYVTYKVTKS